MGKCITLQWNVLTAGWYWLIQAKSGRVYHGVSTGVLTADLRVCQQLLGLLMVTSHRRFWREFLTRSSASKPAECLIQFPETELHAHILRLRKKKHALFSPHRHKVWLMPIEMWVLEKCHLYKQFLGVEKNTILEGSFWKCFFKFSLGWFGLVTHTCCCCWAFRFISFLNARNNTRASLLKPHWKKDLKSNALIVTRCVTSQDFCSGQHGLERTIKVWNLIQSNSTLKHDLFE